MTRGFSLIELLVALAVCLLLSGAVAGMMAPARAAFDRTPAALDLRERGRSGVDLLTMIVRSAGANVGAADGLAALADLMPAVIPLPKTLRFSRSAANPSRVSRSSGEMRSLFTAMP